MSTQDAATLPDLGTLVEDLKEVLTSAAPYVGADSALGEVGTFLAELGGALGAVGTIDSTVKDLSSLVDGAGAVASALDGVPFVGVVTVPAGTVLEAAAELLQDATTFLDEAKATVDPVRRTVDDLSSGIKDVQGVLQDLTVQVPQYLNTVQILDYLLEIADTVVPFLEGTEPGARLAEVVDTLNTVLSDVSDAFSSFEHAMAPVFQGLGAVLDVISDVAAAMGGVVQDTLHAFRSAADALGPVSHGLHRLEDAIAPLRWALSAFRWIMKHVLEPAINWVLKETGLKALVDGLERKVEDWLGISALSDAVGNAGDGQNGLERGTGAAGSAAGKQADSTFISLGSSLDQFRQGHDGVLRSVASQLLTAVTGAGLSDGSGGLPDFPASPPALTGNDGDPAPAVVAVRGSALGSLRSAPRLLARVSPRHPDHASAFEASLALARTRGAVVASPGADGAWPVPPVDPAAWPRTAAMVAAATSLADRLQTIGRDATALEHGLAALEESADFPSTFAASLQTFAATFDDCTSVLQSLEKFDLSVLTALVRPVEELVDRQEADLQRSMSHLPGAVQAIAAVQQAVSDDVAALPTTSALGQAVRRADGRVLGAEQLVATMDAIKQRLTAQGGDLTAWTAAHDQIERAAQAVDERQAELSTTLDTVHRSVRAVAHALQAYAAVLAPVAQHGAGLVAAVPAAQHVARVLGVVESLVDPLQGLFHLACPTKPGTPPAMAGALVTDLADLAAGLTTPPPGQVASLLERFDAGALPCGKLAEALSTAATTLSKAAVADLVAQATALRAALTALTRGLAQQESYTVTDPASGTSVVVTNDLIGQDVVDQLQGVVGSLPAQ